MSGSPVKLVCSHLAVAALFFALGKGDGNQFVAAVTGAMFGFIVCLIVVASELAIRVSRAK